MRSLWRILALRWLRGEGSEALSGDSTVLDLLRPGETASELHSFNVEREPGVSHRAMMSPGLEQRLDPEIVSEEFLR